MVDPIPEWPLPLPDPIPIPAPDPGGGGTTDTPPPTTSPQPGSDTGVDPTTGLPTSSTTTTTTTTTTAPLPTGVNPQTGGTSTSVPPISGWKNFLIWLGALVILWLVLTSLAEAGYGSFANGLAGLILVGALMFMGKQALTNAQNLITK